MPPGKYKTFFPQICSLLAPPYKPFQQFNDYICASRWPQASASCTGRHTKRSSRTQAQPQGQLPFGVLHSLSLVEYKAARTHTSVILDLTIVWEGARGSHQFNLLYYCCYYVSVVVRSSGLLFLSLLYLILVFIIMCDYYIIGFIIIILCGQGCGVHTWPSHRPLPVVACDLSVRIHLFLASVNYWI